MVASRKKVSAGTVSVADAKAALSKAVTEFDALSQKMADQVIANLDACGTDELGLAPATLGGSIATILTVALDGSQSVEKVQDLILQQANELIEALKGAKGSEVVTMTLIRFNHQISVVFSNKPLDDIKELTTAEYFASGGTALYDAFALGISNAIAFEEILLQSGYTTEVIFLGVTDGADRDSVHATADTVSEMFAEIRRRKRTWYAAMIGLRTWEKVDFFQIGHNCGFEQVEEVILPQIPANADAAEVTRLHYEAEHKLRQLFQRVSKSIIRQSQAHVSGGTAGNTVGGGFLDVT